MKRLSLLTLMVGAQLGGDVVMAADWAIYRGSNHDGISKETGWSAEFDGDGPKVLWEAEVGIGFASFTVVEGKVYTTGHAEDQDTVFCFGAVDGKLIWKHSYAADLGDKYYEGGTSATPTVSGGKVYHLSRWGDVFCFEAATGKVVWSKNAQKETEAKIPDWGFAGSPYVAGDLVILNVGQSGMALKKGDGKTVWSSGKESAAGYSTAYPLAGDKGIVVLAAEDAYHAVEVATGKVVWSLPWKTRYGVNAASPIQSGDKLFISSGYNRGCGLFQLGGGTPTAIWENKNLRNQFNSSVLIDGFVYGIDDDESKKASLRCVELATGEVKWTEKGIGFGALMAADGKLIVQTDKGELVVAKATEKAFEEISRAQVLSGRCWTTPVLVDGRLYVRNAEGAVKCLNLKKKG
jgi:outer membrane protein assembly factor BamB